MEPRARAAAQRPPGRILALRVLLLAHAAVVVALWMWTWRALQSHAWTDGGVETDLAERAVSYLVVLAPTMPVNLLAAYWIGRGGDRARLHLAGAGALVAVQQVLLLTPVDPGRSIATGVVFALLVGPIAFAAAAIALTDRSKRWLAADRRPGRLHQVSVEALAWGLTAVLAVSVALGVDEWVEASTKTGEPVGEFDESDVWSRMEEAVTNSATGQPGFPGFERREVQVTPCRYRAGSGLATYRYRLTYTLAPFETTAEKDAYVTAVRSRWGSEDYEILYVGVTYDGHSTITADRADGLTLQLVMGPRPALELQSGCMERVAETVPCLHPQGGVSPERDTIIGLTCAEEN